MSQTTREIIAAEIAEYSKFSKIADAYKMKFIVDHPKTTVSYDSFWGAYKKVLAAEGVVMAPKENKSVPVEVKDVEIKFYDPKTAVVNEEIFTPLVSGKFVDHVISEDIGSMPGTTVVVAGSPSVGKTTATLDLLYSCKKMFADSLKNKKDKLEVENEFIYFSSEMKRVDLQREERKKEWMKNIRSILMNEYPKEEYKALISKVILYGYRMLVIDSFQNIVERLTTFCNMSTGEASQFLLNLIEQANTGHTETGHSTCIYLIQQVTKGGVFVGKNNLKHDTTAMWEFKFDDNNQRYAEFTKSRMNGDSTFKRLYFTLDENKQVKWNEARWKEDRDKEQILINQQELLENSKNLFETSNIFSGKSVSSEDDGMGMLMLNSDNRNKKYNFEDEDTEE